MKKYNGKVGSKSELLFYTVISISLRINSVWVNNITHHTFPRTLILQITRESAIYSTRDIRMVCVVAAKAVPLEDRLRWRRMQWHIRFTD
jgi:hypothetical protein